MTLKQHSFFNRYRLTDGEKAVTDGARIDTDGWLGSRYVVVNGDRFTEAGGYTMSFGSGRNVNPVLLITLIPFSLEALIHSLLRRAIRG